MIRTTHSIAGAPYESTNVVRKEGLEPSRPKAQEPKSCVSANFTTPAGGASLLSGGHSHRAATSG